jgi:hypothetical protein
MLLSRIAVPVLYTVLARRFALAPAPASAKAVDPERVAAKTL